MNQKSLQQYLKLREELADDLVNVESDIQSLNGQIDALVKEVMSLEEYRAELKQVLNGKVLAPEVKEKPKAESDHVLVKYLKKNPGVDRQHIQEGLDLDAVTARNLVQKLSRHGTIINHGSKRHAQWYITGQAQEQS